MLQLAPGGRLLGGRVFQLASKERHWEEGCSSFHRWKGVGRKGVAVPRGKGAGRKGVAACLEGKGQGITLLRRCVHIQGAVCARGHTH